jgi:hypothetical protein
MFDPGIRFKTLTRRACAIAVVAVCWGAGAAAASAATLQIDVPAKVKKNAGYTIKLNGTFTRHEVSGRAFLISVIQYSPSPCKATAQQENTLKTAQFYFGNKGGIFEASSPFARNDSFTAKRLGKRRVCAYLYSQQVSPSSSMAPIARAQKAFKVTA